MQLCLARGDDEFPPALSELGVWPQTVYLLGRLWTERPMVAIVGARAATHRAMQEAEAMAEGLACRGIGIVSGGALGIDSAAHRGALRGGGYTLSIMAGGLDRLYPDRNRSLFEAILNRGGGILSPFDLGCPPIRHNFVARNRIVAALAALVVVIEAQPRSGSLHTARFAAALGRQLAAHPNSPGCQTLIAKGALPVDNADQVLAIINHSYQAPVLAMPPAGSADARLLACLSEGRSEDAHTLARRTGAPLRQTQRRLLALQMRGLILALPGHRYLRSALARGAGGRGG